MHEESNPILNRTSEEISQQEPTRTPNISQNIDDGQSSSRSTLEDNYLQCISYKNNSNLNMFNREPMLVIVDSSCVSNPSSKEILINTTTTGKATVKRNQNVTRFNIPGTSKDDTEFAPMYNCESSEELQMIDINLQSDNDISIDEELSENSLDVHIPSYPGSPRSIHVGSGHSIDDTYAQNPSLREAIEFLHRDKEFLVAAEIGNDKLLDIHIRKGTDVQQVDHLGRNALHLAVCSGNLRAIKLLLDAGVNPNVKDNVGMTPLSLSLMRRPSLLVANMLFDHGARLLPRTNPMDTGLFIQFAMMCTPTSEEEDILKLLVEKGAIINDSNAPGGRQALHFAAMSNNTTLIRLLVSLGADLNMTNHRNETPKDTAETFKCQQAYELLCELEENEEFTTSSTLLRY